jgi:LmbE family N-acetylglucosaminyl deacetylase
MMQVAANPTTSPYRSNDMLARAGAFDERLRGRVIVVSPHLDDAVLSLGATMARAVEEGAQVTVLTVFGCEPGSNAPTDSWDLKSGFSTEGQAAQERRNEDRAACAILGVTWRWFDFGAQPYERRASAEELLATVVEALAGADTVLLPGYPLAHYDHATLGNGLLVRKLNCRNLGLYAEQPYAFDRRLTFQGPVETPPPPPSRADGVATPTDGFDADSAARQRSAAAFTWEQLAAHGKHRRKKLQAVKEYRSQIGSLGLRQLGYLRLHRMLWHEARQGGESIAWPRRPV